ncbi:MAG: mitofilin family membrane protein [Alphaproteobacteria bacterium]
MDNKDDAGAAQTEADPVRRFRLDLPEGWVGIFLLLIVAAVSGGLIATYWPALTGNELGATHDRIAALETRVGQIAAGRAGEAASGMFDDVRRELAALDQRLDAGEARLAALESGAGEGAPPANLAAAQQKIDDAVTRLGKLETAQGATADFASKLGVLETRIGNLEADIARAAHTTGGAMSGLEARVKEVEARAPPPDLAQRLDSFALKNSQTELEARLHAVEALNTGELLRRAAVMLALTQLAQAANDPGSFTLQLETYRTASPGDPMVEVLRPYAKSGVPTRAALAQRFPDVVRSALNAERRADARTLFQRLWANIQSLVSVRRVGEAKGADSESHLARAQARLDANDLPAATAEVRAVKGVAAKPLSNWLRDAYARITLDRAVADMRGRVIQALATPIPAALASDGAQGAPAQGDGP